MTKHKTITGLFDELDRLTLQRWYYFHATGGKDITSCHIKVSNKNTVHKLYILVTGCAELEVTLNDIKSGKIAKIADIEQVEINLFCFPKEINSFQKFKKVYKTIMIYFNN